MPKKIVITKEEGFEPAPGTTGMITSTPTFYRSFRAKPIGDSGDFLSYVGRSEEEALENLYKRFPGLKELNLPIEREYEEEE